MTPEGKVVEALRRAVKSAGGLSRKVSWEGRVGAPDWLVMINGRHCFVECKTKTGRLAEVQKREHERLRAVGGFSVFVIRSTEEAEKLVENMKNESYF